MTGTRCTFTALVFALFSLTLARSVQVDGLGKLEGRATTLPASPKGATLLQFKPCAASSARVPMFVNNQYAKSSATAAYIVQHGESRDFNNYFKYIYNIIGTSGIIVAPNNYLLTDSSTARNWYQPAINLAWYDTGNWTIGRDAIGPTSGSNAINGNSCSSFDTFDALFTRFNDKTLYPNLKQVFLIGNSGGGNMVSRYSQINNGTYAFNIRYIISNAASQAYFSNARPMTTSCYGANYYPNQWVVASKMPAYVRARFTTATALFQQWATRDVVSLIGDLDTDARYPGGTQDCGSVSEGGANRRDRNYAWWAYTNILAGTSASVSSYTGYNQLIASGAKAISTTAFNHQNCVIDNVGHDTVPMFNSSCGRAALTLSRIPAGVGAKYP